MERPTKTDRDGGAGGSDDVCYVGIIIQLPREKTGKSTTRLYRPREVDVDGEATTRVLDHRHSYFADADKARRSECGGVNVLTRKMRAAEPMDHHHRR